MADMSALPQSILAYLMQQGGAGTEGGYDPSMLPSITNSDYQNILNQFAQQGQVGSNGLDTTAFNVSGVPGVSGVSLNPNGDFSTQDPNRPGWNLDYGPGGTSSYQTNNNYGEMLGMLGLMAGGGLASSMFGGAAGAMGGTGAMDMGIGGSGVLPGSYGATGATTGASLGAGTGGNMSGLLSGFDGFSAPPGSLGSGMFGAIDPTTLAGLPQAGDTLNAGLMGSGFADSGLGNALPPGYGLGGSSMAGAPGTLSSSSGAGSAISNLLTTMGGGMPGGLPSGLLGAIQSLTGNSATGATTSGQGYNPNVTNPIAGLLALNYANSHPAINTGDLKDVLKSAKGVDFGNLQNAIGSASNLNSDPLSQVLGRSGSLDESALQRLQQAGVSTDALRNVLGNSNVDLSRLINVYNQVGPNADAFVQSAIDPAQKNISAGYGDLMQSMSQRGLGGSSFASGALGNYMSDTSRSLTDAAASARQQALALQGGLAGQIAGTQMQDIGLQGDLSKMIAGVDMSNLQNQTQIAQLLPQLQLQQLGLQGTLANDIIGQNRANVGLQGQLAGNLIGYQDQNLQLRDQIANQITSANALQQQQQNDLYGQAFQLIGSGLSGTAGTNPFSSLLGGLSGTAGTNPLAGLFNNFTGATP